MSKMTKIKYFCIYFLVYAWTSTHLTLAIFLYLGEYQMSQQGQEYLTYYDI